MAERITPAGRYLRHVTGYETFLPDPLPPSLEWNSRLVATLSEADRALGALAGEGRRLPNPPLLLRPFIRREAVLSSRIEGTQATLGELLAKEAGAVVKRSPEDLREVANYVVALEHGMGLVGQTGLSLALFKELHGLLMVGVRGGEAHPGQLRKVQNGVGLAGCTLWTASYVPPPPDRLEGLLKELVAFMQRRDLPPLIQIGLAHYHFEAIHPFLDGNGRVGRLLISLFLVQRGLLPGPLLYLSAFFEATRWDYYERLRGVTERGEWEMWLEYFLNGVARQAEDAVNRAKRINDLLEDWRRALAVRSAVSGQTTRLAVAGSASKTPTLLVDLLAENPYWTVKGAAQRLEVAYTTAQRAFKRLEELGAVSPVSQARRNRVYCAGRILEILEEPARLTPSEP